MTQDTEPLNEQDRDQLIWSCNQVVDQFSATWMNNQLNDPELLLAMDNAIGMFRFLQDMTKQGRHPQCLPAIDFGETTTDRCRTEGDRLKGLPSEIR